MCALGSERKMVLCGFERSHQDTRDSTLPQESLWEYNQVVCTLFYGKSSLNPVRLGGRNGDKKSMKNNANHKKIVYLELYLFSGFEIFVFLYIL